MQIHRIQLNTSINIKNINLAIGNFDGLHIGHQKIINKLILKSEETKMRPVIMSFDPHPRQFFSGIYNNFNIIDENLKCEILKKLGVKEYIILNFDQSIANLEAEDFIEKILFKKLNIKNLFVGNDFRFGKDRKGDINILKKQSLVFNYSIEILNSITSKENCKISSSLIRKYIQEGQFNLVKSFLGRNWFMKGVVVYGDKRARKMNFPTANIIPPNLIHPKKGVYAVNIIYKDTFFSGIANFGKRPTVDGEKLLLEVHIFNFKLDIYGEDLIVEFLKFIRAEKKFDSFHQLTQQVKKDIHLVKDYHQKIK